MSARASMLVCALVAGCDEVNSIGLPDLSGIASESWHPVKPPDSAAGMDLFAVSGTGPTDVLMVGQKGTILRWNGMDLTQEESNTTADLRGCIAVSPSLAWAVGADAVVVKWDGMSWTVQPMVPLPPPPAGPDGGVDMSMPDGGGLVLPPYFSAVWADQARMIAVGQGGLAVGFDGTMWKNIPTDSPDDLYGVTQTASGIIAVGTLGTIAHYDGTRFHRTALAGFPKTLAGATTGPDGTFLVGIDGALFDYASSSRIMGLPSTFVRAVADAPGGDLFVVGWNDLIARVRNQDVLVYPTPGPAPRWYYGVYAAGQGDIWVVGASGTVLHGPPAVDPSPPDAGMGDGP
ncbi:MAG TPA: hypothetical protein VFD32_23895 [Dehalococcoidia bacterium]|nr:hypothetical protein [Dehalococcoidia bacterium]